MGKLTKLINMKMYLPIWRKLRVSYARPVLAVC